jgi:pyruvate dehydrogenase E1 component alpha subunit
MVGRGVDPGGALAEIMGRSGGLNGGFGGTLHLTDRSAGFLSTSAVVGGSIGIATGAGYRLKRAGGDAVAVSFFGDAALEEGIAFECLNMAALWSLPVLYMCENNARGAPGAKAGEFSSSTMAIQDLADIPGALGIVTEVVDGADVEAVFAAVSRAMARLRDGEGPVFIEAITERWPGSRPLWPVLATGITDLHAAWDNGRIGGEHAGWIRNHDPVLRYARTLVSKGGFTADELHEMDRGALERMDAARAFAEASPLPEPETALHGAFG